MEVFVARRPVFDTQKEVFGYEVAFRSGLESYCEALEAEGSEADLTTFLGLAGATDGKKAFVSIPTNLLVANFPILFDSDAIVASIPSGPGSDAEVVSRCRELKDLGYMLALDNFAAEHVGSPLLEFADFARVNFAETPPEQRRAICAKLADANVQAVAGNIPLPRDFDEAVEAGYTHYQGEFFSKPLLRPGRDIAANKLTYLQLVQEVNAPSLSYDEIATLVEQDVAMAYKLLRFMNSAWFGLRFEIRSVKHALVLLGPKEIRRWVSLVAVKSTGEDKPQELLVRSLTRAKAAEQIAKLVKMEKESSELFLMGMFSVIDALTDAPMAEVLQKLPLKDDIKNVLQGRPAGTYGNIFETVCAYESGDWDALSSCVATVGVDESAIPEVFRNSREWASEALRQI